MGTKDASARAQQEYVKSMAKYLTEEERHHMANLQDDFAKNSWGCVEKAGHPKSSQVYIDPRNKEGQTLQIYIE